MPRSVKANISLSPVAQAQNAQVFANAGPPVGGGGGLSGNTEKSKPDARFRSFAERYIVARASFFRQDPDGHLADQWECMLDARRVYSAVRRMSQHLDPEDL